MMRPVTSYVLRRLGQAAFILWGAFTLTFVLLQVMPGDAVLVKFQDPDLGLTPQQIAAIRVAYGADASLPVQYLQTAGRVLRGDFGYSVQAGVPVRDLVAAALPTTLRLAFCGLVCAVAGAAGLAVAVNLVPFRMLGAWLRMLPALWGAVPVFWFGIALIQVVSFQLHLIPLIGVGPWVGMILPALAISLPVAAPLAQVLLRAADDIQARPFVTVARMKGADRARVLFRHVAPNAILPFLTVAGLVFGELLAGAVVTETIFGLNGLGQLTQQAVAGQDVSVLQAIVLISALGFVIINFCIDLLYPLLDPRLRGRRG